jgi:hypothetical protein
MTLTNLIPTMMGVALLSDNIKEVKKKKPNVVKMGVENIVGLSLIKATSSSL